MIEIITLKITVYGIALFVGNLSKIDRAICDCMAVSKHTKCEVTSSFKVFHRVEMGSNNIVVVNNSDTGKITSGEVILKCKREKWDN